MESADKHFCRAMDYLSAAHRLEAVANGHEALERLSAEYRRRAAELMGVRARTIPARSASRAGGMRG